MPSKQKYTPLKIPVVTVNGVPQKPTALPKIDGPTQSLAVNTGFSDRIFENFSNLYKKDNDGKTPASGTILDASIVYRNNENQVDKKFVASCICMMFSKRMHAKFAEHRWENVKRQMLMFLPVELNPKSVELCLEFIHGVPITLAPENFQENLEKLYITAKYLQILPLLDKIQTAGKSFQLNYEEMEEFIKQLPEPCVKYAKPATIKGLPNMQGTIEEDDAISLDSNEGPPTPTNEVNNDPQPDQSTRKRTRSRSREKRRSRSRSRDRRRRSRSRDRKRRSRSRDRGSRRRSRSRDRRSRSRDRSRRDRRSRSPRRKSPEKAASSKTLSQNSAPLTGAPPPMNFGQPAVTQNWTPSIPPMMPPMPGMPPQPNYYGMPPVQTYGQPQQNYSWQPPQQTPPDINSYANSYEQFKNNYGN